MRTLQIAAGIVAHTSHDARAGRTLENAVDMEEVTPEATGN
jgi:hypothetical protein